MYALKYISRIQYIFYSEGQEKSFLDITITYYYNMLYKRSSKRNQHYPEHTEYKATCTFM